MLELDQVHSYYGDSHVLQGISLRVDQAEAVSLLGRNGVGKTTTIHTIMGFIPPRRGEILFKRRNIVGLRPNRIASAGVGIVPQGRRLFPDLTVEENISLAAREGTGATRWDLEAVYDLFPSLPDRATYRARQLSGGEQQMVAIGRALLTNPELLLLDEPSEGLAPLLVQHIGEVILQLKAQGLSILLVEQNLHLATRVADRIYVMSRGAMVYEGRPDALIDDQEVKQRYLGV